MGEDPLEELLHRCHRSELVPLAQKLGVRPEGMGLGDLARALASVIRARSSHGLGSIWRGGAGLPYMQIVSDLAKKRGVAGDRWPPDVGELELALVRSFLAERWDEMPEADRISLWENLGISGERPTEGVEVARRASEALGQAFGYTLTRALGRFEGASGVVGLYVLLMSPLGWLLRPLLIPGVLIWGLKPDEKQVLASILEVARLRQAVLHRVTIGVVGSPSTGKDAAIKALFGIDSGNISPVAGSTKEVAIQRLPGATALFIVNTPGMGDVVERVTEEARQVLDHIDVYLYLVNAEGGVQARELADWSKCRATGKPVLAVVNKVDVLRPHQKDAFLADVRHKLSCPEEDFVAAAFDPLPQLSPVPIGREGVHAWLARRLIELGKDPAELPKLPDIPPPEPESPPEPGDGGA